MTPGTIVICTDARLSEGRLVEGWRYVVESVKYGNREVPGTELIPNDGPGLELIGVPHHPNRTVGNGRYWKSSRFRPLEQKDVEDKVNEVIADKILGKMGRV